MTPLRHSPYQSGNSVDCWKRLWRSPHWKIQVILRLSTQAQDILAVNSSGCCGRIGIPLGLPEWLLQAHRVTMGDCWTRSVWLAPGQTTLSWGPWFPFPIIPNPNSKTEIETNTQLLEQVLYRLIMEDISLWDTRTMQTCSAKIWQRLSHCTGQSTMRLIFNQASLTPSQWIHSVIIIAYVTTHHVCTQKGQRTAAVCGLPSSH